MKHRKAYRAARVNHVDWKKLSNGHDGQRVVLGMDIGKYDLLGVVLWPDGRFERPWRGENPGEVAVWAKLLQEVRQGRELVVALEPSGVYGDAFRQAVHEIGIPVVRISPKAAHDYAEVFDGVPSQHDGKDAAVVAELAAHGKGSPWPYQPASVWEQELGYWVEEMEVQRRITVMGLSRLEGLLARHWPEATRVLKLSSITLLRALARYGSPTRLAADAEAAALLTHWGGNYLRPEKVTLLLESARTTMGVRQGTWEERQMREEAERALAGGRGFKRSQRHLRRLAKGHPVIEAQGQAVGVPTACVLWRCLGDARDYHCAAAYRKAMGLNLTERSSGTYQSTLRISKRGQPRVRRWLYLASVRLVRQAGVQQWYQAKKAKDGAAAKRALVGVMRKLALALYHIAVAKTTFDSRRVFAAVIGARLDNLKKGSVDSRPLPTWPGPEGFPQ